MADDWGANDIPVAAFGAGDKPAGAPEKPGALSQIGTSLKNQAKGIFDTLTTLVDPVMAQKMGNGIIDASSEQWDKAKAAAKQGNYGEAMHRALTSVPIVGPMVQSIIDKAPDRPYEAATDLAVPALLGAAGAKGGDVVDAAAPYARATVEAAKAGGKDVAVGAAKTAAGVALAKAGPLGEVGDVIAGVPIVKSGVAQMARGAKSSYAALRQSLADTAAAKAETAQPEPPLAGAVPMQGPEAAATAGGTPPPSPIPPTGTVQLPAPDQELFGTPKKPVAAADAPHALPQTGTVKAATQGADSWVAVDKSTGKAVLETFEKKTADAVNREKYDVLPIQDYLGSLNKTAADAPRPEGAYPIPDAERTQPGAVAPKESYQRAAQTVKGRALARYLRLAPEGGITVEEASRMTPEQWQMAAQAAGVNAPSPASVQVALSELDNLYKAKGSAQIDKAVAEGNAPKANFYVQKAAQESYLSKNPKALAIAQQLAEEMAK